jgi:hypothetical protein
MSGLILTEGAAPSTPTTGKVEIYAKTDGKIYAKDDAGTETSFVGLTQGAATASTSGTSIDFTGLPSGLKRIIVSWGSGSTNGSSIPMLQLGDSGGVETTGYLGGAATVVSAGATSGANSTAGFLLAGSMASTIILHVTAILTLIDPATNTWACSVSGGRSDAANMICGGGTKSLSGTLDRIRLTTVTGSDTFDAGTINILYE